MRNLLIALFLLFPFCVQGQVITPGAPGFQRLYSNGTSVGNGADTTVDILMSYTLAAGQLASVGDTIHIRASGTLAATTDSKAVRVTVGSQVVASIGTANSSVTTYTVDVVLIKTGANAQSYMGTFSVLNLTGQPKTGTLTLTDTGAISIQLTGQNTTTASANSITAQMMTVDYEH